MFVNSVLQAWFPGSDIRFGTEITSFPPAASLVLHGMPVFIAAGAVLLYLINYFIWNYLFGQRRNRGRLYGRNDTKSCDDDAGIVETGRGVDVDDEMQACLGCIVVSHILPNLPFCVVL